MAFDLGEARAILARTPAALEALLVGLPAAWTDVNDGAGTWSPHEILAHLINGERTDWIPRTRLILAGDARATFVPFDREGFFAEGRSLPVSTLLRMFDELRHESLRALDAFAIGPKELKMVAQHPGLGPVTLEQLLASWVVHDLGHVEQVSRTMARRYTAEVGPWTAYLGVLGKA